MRKSVVLVLVLMLAAGLALVAGGAAAGPAAAGPLGATLQATFTGQATQTLRDQLGKAVAVSGDTAIVGSQYFGDPPTTPPANRGEAYIYVRSGGVWQQQQVLKAPDETGSSFFGCSVAIQGDTALVGAYGHLFTAGSVYVYTRSGGVWAFQQRLDGPTNSEMGWSVAISGDTLIAGAPAYYPEGGGPPTPGAARVYTRTGGVWAVQQQIAAGDGADNDRFGWSVGLDGDSAVVGAPYKSGGVPHGDGAAYVYTRSGGVWSQRLKVAGSAGANLGHSVALSGQTALAGAPASYNGMGSVTVLRQTGGTWAKQTEFSSGGSLPGDYLGWSVALSGDLAVVGADQRANAGVNYSGAVYVFGRSGDAWVQEARIDPPTPTFMMMFGSTVAVDGTTVLAGEPMEDDYHSAGHVHAYLLTSAADTTPPVTTPQVSPAGWTNKTVTVTLAATDDFSGVTLTQYKKAGAADWQTYTAPFQCTDTGAVKYVCRSTDGAAVPNVEPDVSFTVYRDLAGPATKALANVTAKAGKRASFRFTVTDVTPKATVTLKVLKGKRVMKTVKVGSRPTGSAQSYSWNCGLRRGTYTWKVYATDQAGNAQVKMTGKALTVK